MKRILLIIAFLIAVSQIGLSTPVIDDVVIDPVDAWL